MTALVEATGASFGYGARPALAEVSFAIRAGELVGLVGPNGAGKSTLLRGLAGLLAPSSGAVRLGGVSVRELSRREIARRAALLEQDPTLDLPVPVRDVVALGRLPHLGRFAPEGPEDAAAVARGLAATGLTALADRPVTELSGGERHRVHLARALAQEAPVLLLDEPLDGLDLAHQLRALELLRETVRGERAVLLALHDLGLAARFCPRVLLLARGRLVADGPPDGVLTERLLAQHFGVRASVRRDGDGALTITPLAALAREERT